jgi:hypothetical protein
MAFFRIFCHILAHQDPMLPLLCPLFQLRSAHSAKKHVCLGHIGAAEDDLAHENGVGSMRKRPQSKRRRLRGSGKGGTCKSAECEFFARHRHRSCLRVVRAPSQAKDDQDV